MIYLDNGATAFPKPPTVRAAVARAMECCANPGRGGHRPAMAGAETVYACRERCAVFFDCQPEQVVFTSGCTQALNMAIHSLVKPGDRVVISGFEHNAVTRTLQGRHAQILVAGRQLFDPEDTLREWEKALQKEPKAAVFTHVSNVFGYILPAEEMAALCRKYGVPFVVDAAQSAGTLPISLKKWGADFIAIAGHKGLVGPMGTGVLLCGKVPEPLLFGGTGSLSLEQQMPSFLPDRAEAGTLNVAGIAGLEAGIAHIQKRGREALFAAECSQVQRCAKALEKLGLQVFAGERQGGTLSFVPAMGCEEMARLLARQGVAVRAGFHCAPLAHESAGTLSTGTVRLSFGPDACPHQTDKFLGIISRILQKN